MKLTNRFSISRKIMSGYLVVLTIMIVCGTYSIHVFQRSIAIDNEISNSCLPSLEETKSFAQFVSRSQRLTNNWIYQPNEQEKQELQQLQAYAQDTFKERFAQLSILWSESQQESIFLVLENTDKMVAAQRRIMLALTTLEDYDNAEKVEEAIGVLEGELSVISQDVLKVTEALRSEFAARLSQLQEEKEKSFEQVKWVITASLTLIMLVGIVAVVITTRAITKPVNGLRNSIMALSQGELKEVTIASGNDEIGDMIASCNILITGLKKTTEFTEQIAAGRMDVQYDTLSQIKSLDQALFNMRESLLKVSGEEERRRWVVSGLAKFSEMLRGNQDFDAMTSEVISNLVRYIGANQGALFVVNDDHESERFMEMVSCFAWSRKKYSEQRVSLGEGLVGQTWREKEMTYLTNVPANYIQITSGLGEALPTSVVILPLKLNEEVFGVIEMAMFKHLEDHEIEFLKRVCDTIAAALSTASVNARTQRLLVQTRQQTMELQNQEEEMRQNVEELSATQEELVRKETEYVKRIKELEQRLNLNEIAA